MMNNGYYSDTSDSYSVDNNCHQCFCLPSVGGRTGNVVSDDDEKTGGIQRQLTQARTAASTISAATSHRNTGTSNGSRSSKDVDDPALVSQLAKDLSELTVKERDRVYEEIHGIANVTEETPQLVSQALQQLDDELQRLSTSKMNKTTTAYDLACQMDINYVQDQSFRIMFLRGAEFDVPLAAKRIRTHFEWKLDLFGSTKLCHDITLHDLNDDDMIALQAGSFLFLPGTDRAGRKVFMMTEEFMQAKTWKNQVSYQVYM